MEIVRVQWAKVGWAASLRELQSYVRDPENSWFIVQYTALAWSWRGFPTRALRLVKFLKRNGRRCAIVFHDADPYEGERWRDRVRRRVQRFVMRETLKRSDLAILTVPREKLFWIPRGARNVVYIPVGANLPEPEKAWKDQRTMKGNIPVVAVFSVTAGYAGMKELRRIAEAMAYASQKIGRLRLVLLGRNSEVGGEELKKQLAGENVEINALGVLPAEEVVRVLGEADVFLFTRAPISSRRGSALAGVACGLPVIGREGPETAPPVTDAGIILLPEESTDQYGPALVRVLTNDEYRASLAERNRKVQSQYFSW
ncbi:MAG: glycosyltransferase, partial [Acidobacteriota bacterium]|nr:glycosyltransferase [Acidobacteriota bacterium]